MGGTPDLPPYASDPTLPVLFRRLIGRLIVHRAGRRAVVMETSRIHKIVRPHKAASLVQTHTTAASVLQVTGLRTPRTLGSGDDIVDLELLSGHSLDEFNDAGLPGWERLTEAWSLPGDHKVDLPIHGPRQGTQVLQRWLTSAHRYGPVSQQDPLHEQMVDTCLSLTEASRMHTIAHCDLHDGQLLWDRADLSLLDLDTAAMIKTTLGLGDLWAHADLMAVRGRIDPEAHTRVHGLFDDLARTLSLTEQRLETYYRSSALQFIFVHAFRLAVHQQLPIWVRHCLADASPFMPLDLTNDWNNP